MSEITLPLVGHTEQHANPHDSYWVSGRLVSLVCDMCLSLSPLTTPTGGGGRGWLAVWVMNSVGDMTVPCGTPPRNGNSGDVYRVHGHCVHLNSITDDVRRIRLHSGTDPDISWLSEGLRYHRSSAQGRWGHWE